MGHAITRPLFSGCVRIAGHRFYWRLMRGGGGLVRAVGSRLQTSDTPGLRAGRDRPGTEIINQAGPMVHVWGCPVGRGEYRCRSVPDGCCLVPASIKNARVGTWERVDQVMMAHFHLSYGSGVNPRYRCQWSEALVSVALQSRCELAPLELESIDRPGPSPPVTTDPRLFALTIVVDKEPLGYFITLKGSALVKNLLVTKTRDIGLLNNSEAGIRGKKMEVFSQASSQARILKLLGKE
ncbi:hypothetical protein EGW08_010397 [Elysia chlorotica]|uniref:Uncharacterized protein n=1 Tax=Elysia chlorotica TaxID=188477 RepID=A0A433TK00_ELYCH|nr:hypothetical protein EGW08_010397 [Elysia chlorotica]